MISSAATSPPAAPLTRAYSGDPLSAVQSLLYIIVVALFIITFSAQPFQIPSGSMEPTLRIGDFLLVNKQIVPHAATGDPLPGTGIHRGDIIVFYYPIDPSLHLVKRVIGLPGDRIHLHEGHVYLNGQLLDEPYAIYRPAAPDGFRDNFPRMQSAEPGVDSRWWINMRHLIDHGDLVIPKGQYFVLGDNRNNSEDSRYWGFVPHAAIVGKPFLIYFSLRQPERDDPPATARLESPLRRPSLEERVIDHLSDFARWDRTFQVVR
ncbi:signal peptidase I [Granulicella arctica]|uniref:Signal peptidase I n=1 Tax=Granulicella arctica TaxID=940613 RepID=A0A7Y9TJ81_9BACT|nr:signal peptidase I [Granulicella arctica]NYF78012.1 signal peptidase I [Granulicella arctica]